MYFSIIIIIIMIIIMIIITPFGATSPLGKIPNSDMCIRPCSSVLLYSLSIRGSEVRYSSFKYLIIVVNLAPLCMGRGNEGVSRFHRVWGEKDSK